MEFRKCSRCHIRPAIIFVQKNEGGKITSEGFCIKAIKEANVALVPGDCFGTEGHIRLSYCVSDENLDEGLNRLSTFISTL